MNAGKLSDVRFAHWKKKSQETRIFGAWKVRVESSHLAAKLTLIRLSEVFRSRCPSLLRRNGMSDEFVSHPKSRPRYSRGANYCAGCNACLLGQGKTVLNRQSHPFSRSSRLPDTPDGRKGWKLHHDTGR